MVIMVKKYLKVRLSPKIVNHIYELQYLSIVVEYSSSKLVSTEGSI